MRFTVQRTQLPARVPKVVISRTLYESLQFPLSPDGIHHTFTTDPRKCAPVSIHYGELGLARAQDQTLNDYTVSMFASGRYLQEFMRSSDRFVIGNIVDLQLIALDS